MLGFPPIRKTFSSTAIFETRIGNCELRRPGHDFSRFAQTLLLM
jgi:hypothetical protein